MSRSIQMNLMFSYQVHTQYTMSFKKFQKYRMGRANELMRQSVAFS